MNDTLGVAVVTASDATSLIGGFTTTLTENLPALLALFGFAWGLKFVMSKLNRSTKGKI